MTSNAPLALTMGEPGGIGAELALKAWLARKAHGLPAFVVIDDPARLDRAAAALHLRCPVMTIESCAEAADRFDDGLPVLPLGLEIEATPGRAEPRNAPAVIGSIERAVTLVQEGQAAAVVTNPIQKQSLYAAGFHHPGHTEFLAALTGNWSEPVMMLACDQLRVVPVTVHLPLVKAATTLL